MTIADQITRLNNAKAAIKESIENKGVSVSDSAKLDEYPALIDRIQVGSGGGSGYENPGFYEILTSGGTNYNRLFYYKTISDVSFIESLITSKVIDMSYTFSNFTLSSKLDLSNWSVSNVTNMVSMFNSANVPELDVSGWNIGKVTNIQSMFENCKVTTIAGLESWDTSYITSFDCLFKGCKANILNISNWNISKVTKLSGTFDGCSELNVLDISNWDTSKITDFGSVYKFISGCSNLTEVVGTIDLSSCTSGLAYSSTSYYNFKSCSKLESVYLKNIYKNSTVKNEAKWSINLKDTIVKDECLIYIINELPDLINDKGLTSTTNIKLTLPPTNTLTQEQVQVAIDKGWNVVNTTY